MNHGRNETTHVFTECKVYLFYRYQTNNAHIRAATGAAMSEIFP